MLLRVIFTVLLMFASFSSIAQPNLDWVSTSLSSSPLFDIVEDVFVDDLGNTYACGAFRGSIDFGTYSASASGNTRQCFVVKYNTLGVVQWAISSTGDNAAFGHSIYVDADGAVYVGGHHSSTTTTFGSLSLGSNASEEFFVLKLSPTGVPLHLKGTDIVSNGRNQVLAITGEGNSIYIAGFYAQNPITINGLSTQSPIQEDIFVARLDTALSAANWVNSHGGAKRERATGIAVDGADVFVTGFYGNSQCTFMDTPNDYVLPSYNKQAIWLMNCAASNGEVGWATSAGSPTKRSQSADIVVAGGAVYITGNYADTCRFVSTPETSAPFIYNDTLISNGGKDIFVGKYDYSGNLSLVWSEGGTGNDLGNGITFDTSCGEVQVCGTFRSTVNFGGSTSISANSRDIFVASYSPTGAFNWAFKETSSGNERPAKIYANNGRTSFGGDFNQGIYFGTSPIQLLNNSGAQDHFVASFQCANILPCGPEIICPMNDTVPADPTCSYILTDYIGTEIVFDNCGAGYSVSQSPALGTAVTAGIYPITMTVLDNAGNSNLCLFDLIVEADVNPIMVHCGDELLNQTTLGQGNTTSNFGCTSSITTGEDVYYQVSIPSGNHFLYVTMDNVTDPTDTYVNTFWVGTNCPIGGTCDSADSLNISTGEFSNGSNTQTFQATGPGTYFFVVDSKNDNIQEYDIKFDCLVSGIEFDPTGCSPQDSNNDGVVAYVNGNTLLDVEPCETVTICHDIYIRNENDWEWMDSVYMELGPCYTNINLASITPNSPPMDNGFYNLDGEWDAVYDLSSNSITWQFTSSTGNPWGDGNSGLYSCNLFTFCFEADVTAGCMSSDSLSISIAVGDDGLPLGGTSTGGFASVLSRDFNLVIPDPNFSYTNAQYCQADSNPTPTLLGTSGGTFTATPGIVFTDGSPSTTGIIDLLASSTGPHTITYSLGNCPITQNFNLSIEAEDDATFSYSAISFCQEDGDPNPTVTGTTGGLFSESSGNLNIASTNGLINLGLSAPGTYWVVYTTGGTCPDVDSTQITINALDDATFSYSSTAFCQENTDPTPTITGLGGGSFSEITGDLNITSGTGLIDLSASAPGTYWIVYTTNGTCPNADSVQITIDQEDDASFSYTLSDYCPTDTDPTPTLNGTSGGFFAETTGNLTIVSASGLIDLSASTTGTYWVVYTTTGNCPNTDSTQITINAKDNATITYSASSFCKEETDPLPNPPITTGGVFSEITGDLSISPNTGQIDLGLSMTGTYWIVYTTNGLCPNIDSTQITINSEDDASFTIGDAFCLEGANPVPVISGTTGGTFFASSDINLLNPSTGEINSSLTNSGGPYEYKYVTNGACSDSSLAFITFYSPPLVDAGPDQSIDFQTSVVLSAQLPFNETGNWSSSDESLTFSDITDPNSTVSNLMPGSYEIEWCATNGVCPAGKDKMIIVVADIFIPQAITPNNDGDNDLFALNINDDVECSVEIFNRWGQTVYKNTNYQNEWGGNDMKSKELSNDTYFYVIDINQNTRYKGYVVIKR